MLQRVGEGTDDLPVFAGMNVGASVHDYDPQLRAVPEDRTDRAELPQCLWRLDRDYGNGFDARPVMREFHLERLDVGDSVPRVCGRHDERLHTPSSWLFCCSRSAVSRVAYDALRPDGPMRS